MPRSKKGLERCHKSGTGNNKGRPQTTNCDNRGFIRKDYHSKSIEMSLPVIYVSIPLNNAVIHYLRSHEDCYVKTWMTDDKPRIAEVD